MAEWHQQMIENAQVHVYEMDAALHRAKLNFKTAHKNLEDAKKKKEMF